jgi:hypothetical protein
VLDKEAEFARNNLPELQDQCELASAEELFRGTFLTGVLPMLAEWREMNGLLEERNSVKNAMIDPLGKLFIFLTVLIPGPYSSAHSVETGRQSDVKIISPNTRRSLQSSTEPPRKKGSLKWVH